MKNKYIFISYAHKDEHLARPIIDAIGEKFNIWYDDRIAVGSEWADVILDKLMGCEAVIALISKNFLGSSNCQDEIWYAKENKKKILIVYVEDVQDTDEKILQKFKFQFGRYHAVYYSKYSSADDFAEKLYKNELVADCKKKADLISFEAKETRQRLTQQGEKVKQRNNKAPQQSQKYVPSKAVDASAKTQDYCFPTILIEHGNDEMDESESLKTILGEILAFFQEYCIEAEVISACKNYFFYSFEVAFSKNANIRTIISHLKFLEGRLQTKEIRVCKNGKQGAVIEIPCLYPYDVSLKELLQNTNKNGEIILPIGMWTRRKAEDLKKETLNINFNTTRNVFVGGFDDSTRTDFIDSIILATLFKYSPKELKLLIFDSKEGRFDKFNDIPHLLAPVVTNPLSARKAIDWLSEEMYKRSELVYNQSCQDYLEYNNKVKTKSPNKVLPAILLIVDDVTTIIEKNNENSGLIMLEMLAGKMGLFCMFGAKRPRSNDLVVDMVAKIATKIAFKMPYAEAHTLLDPGVSRLSSQRDAIVEYLNETYRLRTCSVADFEAEWIISNVKNDNKTTYNEDLIKEIEK